MPARLDPTDSSRIQDRRFKAIYDGDPAKLSEQTRRICESVKISGSIGCEHDNKHDTACAHVRSVIGSFGSSYGKSDVPLARFEGVALVMRTRNGVRRLLLHTTWRILFL
jgi:hypothetical protein